MIHANHAAAAAAVLHVFENMTVKLLTTNKQEVCNVQHTHITRITYKLYVKIIHYVTQACKLVLRNIEFVIRQSGSRS